MQRDACFGWREQVGAPKVAQLRNIQRDACFGWCLWERAGADEVAQLRAKYNEMLALRVACGSKLVLAKALNCVQKSCSVMLAFSVESKLVHTKSLKYV